MGRRSYWKVRESNGKEVKERGRNIESHMEVSRKREISP